MWKKVKELALATIGKTGGSEPDDAWKKRILLAEHSPIRVLTYTHTWESIPTWVSVHFVRHKIGTEHFVLTQRDDRTGRARGDQNALVSHTVVLNAQAIINISRRRLCNKAHKDTQDAWRSLLDGIQDDVVKSVAVPECIYRGFCPEFSGCGYSETDAYKARLAEYRKATK